VSFKDIKEQEQQKVQEEKIKQELLAELKGLLKDYNNLNYEYENSEKFLSQKSSFLNEGIEGFKSFFKEQGFLISEKGNSDSIFEITATVEGSTFEVECTVNKEAFELHIVIKNKEYETLYVRELRPYKDKCQCIIDSDGELDIINKERRNDVLFLKTQINNIKEDISEIKNLLNNINPTFFYRLHNDESQVTSIVEYLNDLDKRI